MPETLEYEYNQNFKASFCLTEDIGKRETRKIIP